MLELRDCSLLSRFQGEQRRLVVRVLGVLMNTTAKISGVILLTSGP